MTKSCVDEVVGFVLDLKNAIKCASFGWRLYNNKCHNSWFVSIKSVKSIRSKILKETKI